MKLKNNDTTLSIKYEVTDSKLGIKATDYWIKVLMDVKNNDFTINIDKEIISLNELKMLSKEIDNFIRNSIDKKITFIKNYLIFEFKSNQIVEQKLFFDEINRNKFYSIWYTKDEIIEFNNIIKNFLSEI